MKITEVISIIGQDNRDLSKMLNIGWELRTKTKTIIISHKNHLSRQTLIAEKMVERSGNRWRIRSTLGEAVDSWLREPRLLAIHSHLPTTSWPPPNVDEKLWASHPQMGALQFGILWGTAPQPPHCPETQQVLGSVLSQGETRQVICSSLGLLTLFLCLFLSPQINQVGKQWESFRETTLPLLSLLECSWAT